MSSHSGRFSTQRTIPPSTGADNSARIRYLFVGKVDVKIFISYSRRDSEFVDRLREALDARHFTVWVDREDIRGGDEWRAAISAAIRSSEFFLLVLTSDSAGSDSVKKELTLAEHAGCNILPIVHDFQECAQWPHKLGFRLDRRRPAQSDHGREAGNRKALAEQFDLPCQPRSHPPHPTNEFAEIECEICGKLAWPLSCGKIELRPIAALGTTGPKGVPRSASAQFPTSAPENPAL